MECLPGNFHHSPRGFSRFGCVLLPLAFAWAAGAASLPIGFEPNRGQASGDYVAHASGFSVALRADGIDFVSRGSRVRARLAGARPAKAEAEDRLPGTASYFIGQDRSRWITGLPTFGRVRYRGVYPGIDAVYYGNGGRLEYDFVVAPGADPRRIRMTYEGTPAPRLDASGALVAGPVRQPRPLVYQEIDGRRREIPGRYVLRGNTVRFAIGTYDRARPLVIDPALTWATFYDGYQYPETGEAVAVDSSGNIYLAGTTFVQQDYGYGYLAKLNPSGTAASIQTYVGGQSGDSECHAIAVDSSGNIYLAGETYAYDFPADTTYGAYAGYVDEAFVSEVNAAGTTLLYSHFLGGSGSQAAYGIALDGSHDAMVTGYTDSPDFPIGPTSSVSQKALPSGATNAFVTKFGPTGTALYSTYLGGSAEDVGYSIVADKSGNAYVTGSASSTNFPVTAGAFQPQIAGGIDAFVSKVGTTGTLIFSTYLGGSQEDDGFGITVDASGAVYVAGATASPDFPTASPAQAKFGGGTGNAFVTKLNGSGSALTYSTYLGGSGEDEADAIVVDATGNAYIAGTSSSTDFPVADAFQPANAGTTNAVVAGLNPSGGLQFASYLGGSNANGEYGQAAAVNCTAGLVVAGTGSSSDFPATAGVLATAPTAAGEDTSYVASIGAGGMPAIQTNGVVNSASLSAGPVAPGSLVSVLGTSLGGATVTINGTAPPMLWNSADTLVLQLPYEAAVGSATVTVTNGCGSSPAVTFAVAQAAPYVQQSAAGNAVAVNLDGSTNSAANPASVNSYITVTLTGIGPLDNPVPTGSPAPSSPFSRATLPYSATIGGWDAPVYFLGLMPGTVGWAQANLLVPGLSPGPYPVVITIGGVASNGPTVFVH